jgi:ribosomal protein S18 acetylase RimI-like enzyme
LTIVRAAARDLPRILAIERDCFGRDAWDEDIFRVYLSAWPELFLIAKRGARTVGYSLAAQRGNQAAIESIAVEPGQVRRGIGSDLLRRTLKILKRGGVASIGLMVEIRNEPAIALYKQHGFRRTRIVRNYYGRGRHGWRMSLEPQSW